LLSSTFNPLLIPQVEEISATVSHKKAAEAEKGDPLDAYCEDNPDADECR
jgi:CP12 domain